MWDNQRTITRGHETSTEPPPRLDCTRVGVTLRVETASGQHLIAEYPEVHVNGTRRVLHMFGYEMDEPYGVHLGVKPDESFEARTNPRRIARPVTRDLDLRILGRLQPPGDDGALAWFTDVAALRAYGEKHEAENRALRAEVRALRRRVRALGGDA
jgi:hypothetical protein